MKVINSHKIDDKIVVDYHYGDPKKYYFDNSAALALFLLKHIVFVNDHWWEKEWSDEQRKLISFNVNCNDVFFWGCADAEELLYSEIESLYSYYMEDNDWGPAVWCCIKRNMMPQKPAADAIRSLGIWDIDNMGLEKNLSDGDF